MSEHELMFVLLGFIIGQLIILVFIVSGDKK